MTGMATNAADQSARPPNTATEESATTVRTPGMPTRLEASSPQASRHRGAPSIEKCRACNKGCPAHIGATPHANTHIPIARHSRSRCATGLRACCAPSQIVATASPSPVQAPVMANDRRSSVAELRMRVSLSWIREATTTALSGSPSRLRVESLL